MTTPTLKQIFTAIILTVSVKCYSVDEKPNLDDILNRYEAFNPVTGGDSTRTNSYGKPCEGWVVDLYKNGAVMHKGYYVNGQLKTYNNYFLNGRMERQFKALSVVKALFQTYFISGNTRSKIIYLNGNVITSEEYNSKGILEFTETYDKHNNLLFRKAFSEEGISESSFERINKKGEYEYVEFYSNGVVKEKGTMFFNTTVADYQRNGVWLTYNEKGTPVKKEEYSKGSFITEVEITPADMETPMSNTKKSNKKSRIKSRKLSV